VLATSTTALPDIFRGRRRDGFTSHLFENDDPSRLDNDLAGTSTISQILDHFDLSNTETWHQTYFFNHAYVKDESKVNILYNPGEGAGKLSSITSASKSYVYYAQQLNADLYALEHRFYGTSQPTEDTFVENLKFLSSRQAIEDIAEFIRQINKNKAGEQKWIVVGGSYAGALSAWVRLKHPELIAGALASSAPILAQLDFYGYLQMVDADFKTHGGLCYDHISAGIDAAQKLLQSEEGRETLTNLFKISPPLSAYDGLSSFDIDIFFSYLISPFEYSAQYNKPTV
ncbi:hypothetical protein PMAYCL1PPCAC_16238, partial [Pristionchus mayeri]